MSLAREEQATTALLSLRCFVWPMRRRIFFCSSSCARTVGRIHKSLLVAQLDWICITTTKNEVRWRVAGEANRRRAGGSHASLVGGGFDVDRKHAHQHMHASQGRERRAGRKRVASCGRSVSEAEAARAAAALRAQRSRERGSGSASSDRREGGSGPAAGDRHKAHEWACVRR